MKLTIDYLDEAKEKLGIESDNAFAKYIGITRGGLSSYRNRRSVMDDYTCIRIGEILEIDPLEVIAAANFEREQTGPKKEYWQNFLTRYGHTIKGMMAVAIMSGLFATSPEGQAKTQDDVFSDQKNTVYYVKSRRRKREKKEKPASAQRIRKNQHLPSETRHAGGFFYGENKMTRRIAQAAHGLTSDRVMMILMNFDRIQLTRLCGVNLDTVNDWFAGREPVPFVVLEFLRFLSGRLPPAFGELGGWYFADGRLIPSDCTWRDGVPIELIKKARYLAVSDRQLNRALEQIKRLEKERDFYKKNCHRQARFGMMVNALFGWD